MKLQKSLIASEKGNNLATLSFQERLNLREILKDSEAREWIKRYQKKILEEGRGEAQHWWQETLKDIAKKRGHLACEDLRERMNNQGQK